MSTSEVRTFSFDVNNDQIEDEIQVKFTRDADGNINAEIDGVTLKDENGEAIPDQDKFIMIDGQKITNFAELGGITCGSTNYHYLDIEPVVYVIPGISAPALFSGELVQLEDGEFVNVSFGIHTFARNVGLKPVPDHPGAVYLAGKSYAYDLSQCHIPIDHELSDAEKIYYSIGSDNSLTGYERLEATAQLVQLGETQLAKEIYKSIGNNSATSISARVKAAEALLDLHEKSAAVNIYYSMASNNSMDDFDRMYAADKLVELGEIELAKTIYKSIGSDSANYIGLRFKAARSLLDLDEKSAATNIYFSMLSDNSPDQWDLFSIAEDLVKLGEIQRAKEIYKSLGNNPANAISTRLKAAEALAELEKQYPSSSGN